MKYNQIPFFKVTGSGNDFVIIDNRGCAKIFLDAKHFSDIAKYLCRRRFSIGADGLIILSDAQDTPWDYRMIFYNSDGSMAEMCGNAARCLAYFVYKTIDHRQHQKFICASNVFDSKIQANGTVSVSMRIDKNFILDHQIKLEDNIFSVSYCTVGVPHAVVFSNDLEAVDISKVGRYIRYLDVFGNQGSNVNFVFINRENSISIRTYERGVEGETLACGTGSVASVFIASKKGLVFSPVEVLLRSREELTIDITKDGCSSDTGAVAFLTGGTTLCYNGVVDVP